jgi:hypothetical protein
MATGDDWVLIVDMLVSKKNLDWGCIITLSCIVGFVADVAGESYRELGGDAAQDLSLFVPTTAFLSRCRVEQT